MVIGALCGGVTLPDYITADFTRVNFQPDANDIVAGWLVDDGDAFGLRSGGEIYGWVLSGDPNDPNSNYQAVERDPNVPCSALKKTLNFMKNESLSRDYDWECAVDNGVYYVEITAGDPDGDSSDPNIYSSCRYILNAEGVEVLDGVPTASKRWISGSATVTVTDGRLTISGDSSALHNCISYVKFLKAPIGEMPSSVDLEFSYDGRGNLLEDAHFEYAWDGSDRIVEITDKSWKTGDNGPQKTSYVYDAMGRRVLTRWHYESSTTQYAMVYDGVAPIEQGEISEGVVQRFYYEGKINKPALVEQFDATTGALTGAYVPLTDDRGTVVGVYDVKVGNSTYGQLVEKLHYNSTGLARSYTDAGAENLRTDGTGYNLARSQYIPFGWTGMYRDPFTGHYHTHFRDYDPLHGRWLSEDPAGYKDGLNLYAAYMGVNGVDLLGLGDRAIDTSNDMLIRIVQYGEDFKLQSGFNTQEWGWKPKRGGLIPLPGWGYNPDSKLIWHPRSVFPETFSKSYVDEAFRVCEADLDLHNSLDHANSDVMIKGTIVATIRLAVPFADAAGQMSEGEYMAALKTAGFEIVGGKVIKVGGKVLSKVYKGGKKKIGGYLGNKLDDVAVYVDDGVDSASRHVTPPRKGPLPNNGKARPHGNADHDTLINNKIDEARKKRAKNIRKNQQQVNANGEKVGTNRPDVQYDLNRQHYNYEIDRTQKSSTNHQNQIINNDPDAESVFELMEN